MSLCVYSPIYDTKRRLIGIDEQWLNDFFLLLLVAFDFEFTFDRFVTEIYIPQSFDLQLVLQQQKIYR